MRNSQFITVILISDGQEKIQGTPYDTQINNYYEMWQKEQDQAKVPFLTLLRAERGQFTTFTVNTPPWPLEMPALPTALLPPPRPQTVQTSTLPPLIVSGRKPPAVSTQDVARMTQPEPTPSNVTTNAVSAQPDSKAMEAIPNTITVTLIPTNAASSNAAAASTKEVAASESTNVLTADTGTRALKPDAAAKSVDSVPATRERPAVAKADPPARDVQLAAAPPQPIWKQTWVWIAGGAALLGATVVLALILWRRARAPLHISLITRSIDGKKK
jgi:hypothetical protein